MRVRPPFVEDFLYFRTRTIAGVDDNIMSTKLFLHVSFSHAATARKYREKMDGSHDKYSYLVLETQTQNQAICNL